MLLLRAIRNAAWQNVPWSFALRGNNRCDRDVDPSGVVSFAMAENANRYVYFVGTTN
jgi:hypothetical protein